MPAVSVLLPFRNAAAHLPGCLLSLKRQTLEDFELLLVDDGSTDAGVAAARAAWGDDRRLRLLQPGAVGLVDALNLGLEACRAPLVARMDADDTAMPERLAKQQRLLASEPSVAVVGCQVEPTGETPAGEGYRHYLRGLNGLADHDAMMRERFVESPLAHPSVMFRRGPFLELGGYRDMGWPEDYDLWLRAAAAGLRFAKLQQVLLGWRDHSRRLSRQHPRYSREAFLRCKAHHLARGPLAGRPPLVVWGAGPTGRRLSRLLASEGVPTSAFVDISPRLVGRIRRGVPVLAPEQLGRPADRLLVAAVAARGAREPIRRALREAGWTEGENALFAA
jgi:glycosyltransferase involved in cell wall biosynthesis